MSEKEFVHVEVDQNYHARIQIHCSPETLVVIIAAILIRMSKKQDRMSLRKMLDDIIWLTESEEKDEIDQMIDKALRRIQDGRTD